MAAAQLCWQSIHPFDAGARITVAQIERVGLLKAEGNCRVLFSPGAAFNRSGNTARLGEARET
jgi:hypothetical protein